MATHDHPDGADRGDTGDEGRLPFTVELVGPDGGMRVLARAANAPLARAMFVAARTEYPERRVLLKCRDDTVADSAASP